MCKTFDDNINASEFLLDSYKIQNLSNKAAHNYAHALRYVLIKISRRKYMIIFENLYMFKYCPDEYITQKVCD